MRALLFIFLFGLVNTICNSQNEYVSYGLENVFIEKGDYYFDNNNFKKAIVYYNIAFEKDADYNAILKKAEAYTALGYIV